MNRESSRFHLRTEYEYFPHFTFCVEIQHRKYLKWMRNSKHATSDDVSGMALCASGFGCTGVLDLWMDTRNCAIMNNLFAHLPRSQSLLV